MNLDDRLKDIILDIPCGNLDTPVPDDRVIAQIKQAFADETGLTKLMQDMANLHANMKQDMIRLGLTTTDPRLMTGQEWYDRFEKELWQPPKQTRISQGDDGESHDRFYRTGGEVFMYNRALEAAKRAAGL